MSSTGVLASSPTRICRFANREAVAPSAADAVATSYRSMRASSQPGPTELGSSSKTPADRTVGGRRYGAWMDWKLELVYVPVTDVDRAKAFYVDQVGFNADYDHVVNEDLRFVQLTPPGSACSIAFGIGLTEMQPGSLRGVQFVVPDAELAREELVNRGVDASNVDVQPWGSFVTF